MPGRGLDSSTLPLPWPVRGAWTWVTTVATRSHLSEVSLHSVSSAGLPYPRGHTALVKSAAVVQNPPFLYGTHYSCPGYVMYWLVRAAPAHLLRCHTGASQTPLIAMGPCSVILRSSLHSGASAY